MAPFHTAVWFGCRLRFAVASPPASLSTATCVPVARVVTIVAALPPHITSPVALLVWFCPPTVSAARLAGKS